MNRPLTHPDAVQCVECSRYRVAGQWTVVRPSEGDIVTHTICPACQPAMLDELRWEMEFPSWPPEKQIQAIRLRAKHIPMDATAVRERLGSMGIRDGAVLLRFLEELKPVLVERLCPYCRVPIDAEQLTASRSGYLLHADCARNLTDSIRYLEDLDPQSHLDAYMDVARIPHGVRHGVRKDMET